MKASRGIRWVAFVCALAVLAPVQGRAVENAGAIGQIVPRSGVVMIVGVPGATVKEMRVKTGDVVKAGDLLMTLDGPNLKNDEDLANVDLQGARMLAASQIAAQSLAVKLASERLNEATRELTAYRALGTQSTSQGEMSRLQAVETQARLSLELEQARAKVVAAETGRSVQTASKRLDGAKAAMEVRAPGDGTILRIDSRVGQRLAGDPAMQMADLRTMYVTCQVYVGDLLKLAPGMKATIKSPTLPKPLTGTIEEIGRLVDTRARLGDVRIRLDSADPANRLVGMEVEVVIAR